jgi:hypothetical protein
VQPSFQIRNQTRAERSEFFPLAGWAMSLGFAKFRRTLLILFCCTLSSLLSAQTFTSTTYDVGTNPRKLVRADLNNDGAIDLVTANEDGSITVLLNNGNGTFHRLDAAGGTLLSDVFAGGDINKDGKQDLVIVDQLADGTSNLNILYGRGDGTFNAPVTVANHQDGEAVAVGDFNSDGNLDIAFGWNSTSATPNQAGVLEKHANITVYFGDGAGGFPTHHDMLSIGAQANYADGETGYQIRYMNIGDFNHDGKMDFAIAECCGGTDVELGAAATYLSNGDGTFSEHILYASVPSELRVSDIDGNGTTDLLIPYNGCHTPCNGVTTYLNAATSPQGQDLPDTFGANGLSDHYYSATVGAFNGPGTRTIAYSSQGYFFNDSTSGDQGELSFAKFNGSGFTLLNSISTGSFATRWLTSADFNHDGYDDLAAIQQTLQFPGVSRVVVMMNNGPNSTSCSATTNRTVKICSPSTGSSVTSPVQVIAGIRSDAGVKAAQIYVDGTKVYSGPVGMTLVNQSLVMSAGTHKITVKGWDSAGSFSASVTITVVAGNTTCSATANRTVKICSPTAGSTVSSPVDVLAGLRSDSGISAAQIYLDGVRVFQAPAGTKTVDQNLSMSAGSHRITVKGWDSGGSFSQSESITVH